MASAKVLATLACSEATNQCSDVPGRGVQCVLNLFCDHPIPYKRDVYALSLRFSYFTFSTLLRAIAEHPELL